MAIAGLIAALCQFTAHHLMRESKAAYIPRYVVGSAIVLVCFAGGWLADTSHEPITALVYLYFASFIGTRIGYATDPKPPKPAPDLDQIVAALDKRAAAIAGEHSEDESRNSH